MSTQRLWWAALTLLALFSTATHADMQLDSIQFDPAIIASGDRVDIVVQFHDTGTSLNDKRIGNPDYQYHIALSADDTLTERYVLIEDSAGDDVLGVIARDQTYNRRFRVKVQDNAPPGQYEFKLIGTWYYKGQPTAAVEYLRFSMDVKKAGATLSVANVVTSPQQVRSGDKTILMTTSITNTGEKTAQNVRLRFTYPDGISASYTNNNEQTIGSLAPAQTTPVQFTIDTERNIPAGTYNIGYSMSYEDTDRNGYSTHGTFPFVIKKKPDVKVISAEGSGRAGQDIELHVTVENTGEETADAVDVRLLKQSSQPFDIDVRSEYLGRLEPGQQGTAIFSLHAHPEAELREHTFSLLIRATGDSNDGDDGIYTYADAATLRVTDKQPNPYPWIGAGLLALIVIVLVVRAALPKRKRG